MNRSSKVSCNTTIITQIISIGKVNEGIEVENKVFGNTLYLKNGTFISFPGGAWLAKEIFENLTQIAEKDLG